MSDKLIFKPHPWHGVPVGKGAPGKLTAFKHHGFWQCMDTMRDKEYLKKLLKEKNAPWKN